MSDIDPNAGPPEMRRNGNRRPQHAVEQPVMHEPVHTEEKRRRRRTATTGEDKFYFPVDQIPEGSSYEWKRHTVLGKEDPFYIASLREQGWEPVDPKNHPNLLPPGYAAQHIIKDGMILMERPTELTDEARAEQRKLAKTQIREAEQRLGKTPEGQLPRDHEAVRGATYVRKEMMRPMVIDEG